MRKQNVIEEKPPEKKEKYKPKGRVYVVKPNRQIHWPDGTPRGEGIENYAIRADDPTAAHYFKNGEPSMMKIDNDAQPDPPENWPPRWRNEAGRDWWTKEEVEKDDEEKEQKEERSKAQTLKKTQTRQSVAGTIPKPDEPVR